MVQTQETIGLQQFLDTNRKNEVQQLCKTGMKWKETRTRSQTSKGEVVVRKSTSKKSLGASLPFISQEPCGTHRRTIRLAALHLF